MAVPPRGCSGDGCNVGNIWPLHSVRYRGRTTKLCTSCFLKSNLGAFCSACFDLLASSPALVHCKQCPAVAHRACLQSPESPFLCRSCVSDDPRFSYFSPAADSLNRRHLDEESARALLAAARISSASLSRTAAIAWVEAERKVREAAITRKRAEGALEHAIDFCKKKRELHTQPQPQQEATTAAEPKVQPKKKTDLNHQRKPPLVVQQKSRDRDRWERFNNPCGGASLKDDSAAALPQLLKGGRGHAEEQIKGSVVSNDFCVKAEKAKSLPSELDSGLRVSQPPQDSLLAARSNAKAMVAGLKS